MPYVVQFNKLIALHIIVCPMYLWNRKGKGPSPWAKQLLPFSL